MKLSIAISNSEWKAPTGDNMRERDRQFQLASALRDIASSIENCFSAEGSISRENGLSGKFKINYAAE
jgi:hypothetical protein